MKHKLLTIIALLVFIVVSTSSTAMHSTILGKTILVALVVALAYFHKVAGFIAVIYLIILYQSQSGVFYYNSPYEGFTATDASGNTKTITITKDDGSPLQLPKELKLDISGNLDIAPSPSQAQGQGQEGFDLLGTEDTMRKGKQSNTINVKKSTTQTGSLLPFENAKYVENFLVLG